MYKQILEIVMVSVYTNTTFKRNRNLQVDPASGGRMGLWYYIPVFGDDIN